MIGIISFYPIYIELLSITYFIIEPNSLWVGYIITNDTLITDKLPPGLELAEISVFYEKPRPYIFFNMVHKITPFFNGDILEVITVVKNISTCQKSFFILDHWTTAHLISDKECIHGYIDNIYRVIGKKQYKNFKLLKQFAIEANEYIYYPHQVHPMSFNETAISNVRGIDILYINNTLWTSVRNNKPDVSFYYPHEIKFNIDPRKIHPTENYCSIENRNFLMFSPLLEF